MTESVASRKERFTVGLLEPGQVTQMHAQANLKTNSVHHEKCTSRCAQCTSTNYKSTSSVTTLVTSSLQLESYTGHLKIKKVGCKVVYSS